MNENESRYDERLKSRVEESTCLTYTGFHDKTNKKYMEIKMRSDLKVSLASVSGRDSFTSQIRIFRFPQETVRHRSVFLRSVIFT
jgi:hypothetical protein